MIGDEDLPAIFETGDFDTPAVFTISTGPTVTLTVNGWFTGQSDEVTMFGQVQIEAQKASFTCSTDEIATVRNKMSVVINSVTYIVERIQNLGVGVSVVYLKG